VDNYVAKVGSGPKVVMPKMGFWRGYLAYCTDPEGNTFGMMQKRSRRKVKCHTIVGMPFHPLQCLCCGQHLIDIPVWPVDRFQWAHSLGR